MIVSSRLTTGLSSVLALLAGTTLLGQCPNQGRVKIDHAGKSNSSNRQCATFQITVGVAQITSPAQCEDSFVWRDADEFQCGGTLADHCCDPNDHRVNISLFGPSNTCPQPPVVMPTNLKEAFSVINCGSPVLTRQTFNWSAKAKKCDSPDCGKNAVTSSADPQHNEENGGYTAWHGQPDPILPPADSNALAGWAQQLHNIPATELPELMRKLWLSCPPWTAVDGLQAKVVRTVTGADGTSRTFSYSLRGAAAEDGRFSMASTSIYESGGQEYPTTFDVSFDHRALYRGAVGASFYSAIARTRSDFHTHLTTVFAEVLPVLDWVRGPLWIPLRNDIAWESAPAIVSIAGQSIPVLQITERCPNLNLPGRRVYDVDASGAEPRVLRIRSFDEANNCVLEREFSDFATVAPGETRPLHMVTRWFAPLAALPHATESLHVDEYRRVMPDSVKWRRESDLGKWYVFR